MAQLRNILKGLAKGAGGIVCIIVGVWISTRAPAALRTIFRDFEKTIGSVLLALGAGLLTTAVVWWVRIRFPIRSGKTARGTIVDNVAVAGIDDETIFFPRFTFSAVDGKTIDVQSHRGTSPPSYAKGDSITVIYDPHEPSHAEIKNLEGLGCGLAALAYSAIILSSGGIFCLMAGC